MLDEMSMIGEQEDRRPGRALVALEIRPVRGSDDRPLTDFLAQLIACDRHFPAYRKARRAEPTSGASAYADLHQAAAASHLDRSV